MCVKTFVEPATIAYENVTMHANVTLQEGNNVIYAMEGLSDQNHTIHFVISSFKVVAGKGVIPAREAEDFKIDRVYNKPFPFGRVENIGVLQLLNGLDGPQDIEITIDVLDKEQMTHKQFGILHRSILRIYVSGYNVRNFHPESSLDSFNENTIADDV